MSASDPFTLFQETFDQAIAAALPEPNAMTLATADAAGVPSARIVLLKGFDRRGFVFFTNLESRKGVELRTNPNAALCFFWQPLGKQVRIVGTAEQVSDHEADEYFATRARGSQIGAWASQQSRRLGSREELLALVREIEERFEGMEIPRPPHWSGFRITPTRFEFWTAGEFRLHDRLIFERRGDEWESYALFP